MKKKMSLTVRLTMLVLVGTILVFSLIMGDFYFSSRDLLVKEARKNAEHMAQSGASRLEQEFLGLAEAVNTLAVVLETENLDRLELLETLRMLVTRNSRIFASTVAYAPFAFEPQVRAFAPYFFKYHDAIKYKNLASPEYDYFRWDWFQEPKKLGRPVWSEPYFDEGGGGILMCTYSVPFYHEDERGDPEDFLGVATGDLSLWWLQEFVSGLKPLQSGYGFLMSRKGVFITHPEDDYVMVDTLDDLAQKCHSPAMAELARKMRDEETGFERIESGLADGPAYVAFDRVRSTGWTLAVVVPEAELFADLNKLNQRDMGMVLVGVLLLLGVALLISRSVTRPIRTMTEAAGKMAAGDLDIDLSNLAGQDEVGRLAAAFSSMSRDLKQYIKDLTETTAAKERIQSELNIAASIQRSILPTTFPPFPNLTEISLHAILNPAREVGGDFYDFEFLDEDHLMVTVADVSGKGVPAALFMMVSRTLLQTLARNHPEPSEILAEANNLLEHGNESGMFVTVFLACYEVSTGRMTFSNAGHNPAMLVDVEGEVIEFGERMGPVLGLMPNARFKQEEITIKVGEMLVLYTDGVTEAPDADMAMFGVEGLKKVLNAAKAADPKQVCHDVIKAVDDFQPREQFDDTTLLVLKREQ